MVRRCAYIAWIGVLFCPSETRAEQASAGLELRLEEWSGARVDASGPLVLEVVVQTSGDVIRHEDAPSGPKRLTPAVRTALSKLLADEAFFTISKRAEACPPDLGFKTIAATAGARQHKVSFCGVDVRSPAVRSLLRIWYRSLTLVSNAGAVQVPAAHREFVED